MSSRSWSESRTVGSLYCGPDLLSAEQRSTIGPPTNLVSDVTRSAAHAYDVVTHKLFSTKTSEFVGFLAKGTLLDSSAQRSVLYVGSNGNHSWCFDSAFSHYESIPLGASRSKENAQRLLSKYSESCDITFADGLEPDQVVGQYFSIPAWVKQRMTLLGDWQAQIEALRSRTRQEVSRLLRKHSFECRVSDSAATSVRFYDDFYLPYISQRFGEQALIVDRKRFIRECSRGHLLLLSVDGVELAGAMLRKTGGTMTIVWTGSQVEHRQSDIRGVTDVLDYCSMLYAHLRACGKLDFGPSRPDLLDGALRYKRKWGCSLHAGLVPQPQLHIGMLAKNFDDWSYLSRHVFVQKIDRKLRALVFADPSANRSWFVDLFKKIVSPGIDEYLLLSPTPVTACVKEEIARRGSAFEIHHVSSVADALATIADSS